MSEKFYPRLAVSATIEYKNARAETRPLPIREILERYAGLEDAAAEIVETIGCVLHWPWVACWLPTPDGAHLRAHALWTEQSADSDELIRYTKRWTPRLTEGMVGKCWTRQRSITSVDLPSDMALPRSLIAHRAGLKAGLWIPISGARNPLGVLELLTDDVDDLGGEKMALIESVGIDIGQRYDRR